MQVGHKGCAAANGHIADEYMHSGDKLSEISSTLQVLYLLQIFRTDLSGKSVQWEPGLRVYVQRSRICGESAVENQHLNGKDFAIDFVTELPTDFYLTLMRLKSGCRLHGINRHSQFHCGFSVDFFQAIWMRFLNSHLHSSCKCCRSSTAHFAEETRQHSCCV